MSPDSSFRQGELDGLGAAPALKALVLVDEAPDLELWYAVPEPLLKREIEGCRVQVPLRRRQVLGTILKTSPVEGQEGFVLRSLGSLQHQRPLIPPILLKLASWMADYYACRLETAVRGMVPEMIRTGSGGFKTRKVVRLAREIAGEEIEALGRRAKRQAAIIERLKEEGVVLLSEMVAEHSSAAAAVKRLEELGWVKLSDEIQARDPGAAEAYLPSQALELNDEQAAALRVLEEDLDAGEKRPVLLKGVTGSGKTEIYLQIIAQVIGRGRRAIVLVPEISLTPQTMDRFKRRFAEIQDQVAILHSHLSEGERHDEWRKILDGKAQIVIGARSAIFAPLTDVGLIVVDEEHENTYKQENPPRYQGRDIAVVRAKLEGATLLLGSATPSLESYQNALSGKYRLVELTRRADDQKLPVTRVVDMRTEGRGRRDSRERGGQTIVSEPLRIAIEQRLDRREQTILFLNRRGFSPSVICQDCGHRVECPHCSVTLTYHEGDARLICHLCGYLRVPLRRCPECSGGSILMAGYGTERVEKVLRKVFPRGRVVRVDTDVMKRKNQLQETLNDFQAQKYDIMLGTQMIAKGLHFPNVTLVGVLNADLGLHIPDFRAGERTFQLLTQVAGRAGRGEVLGEVLVQTFTPHNPSIQFARQHDFDGFAEQELEARKALNFPPFVHVAIVTVRSEHERRAEFCMETLAKRLKEGMPEGVTMSEPMPSPLVRMAGQYRFQVLMRAKNPRPMVAHVREHLRRLSLPEDVIATLDVDAYNLS